MKKLICMILLLAVVFSCCACGQKPAEDTKPAENKVNTELTPEQKYGHIDQNKLLDGMYKIWNAEGVKNIVNHPEADFEILCDIDMAGAVLAPIGTADAPFKGLINGGNFTISNFTVQGGDEESFGFFGVNKGAVTAMNLTNVTFQPGAKAKNIGTLVGLNQGRVNRSSVSGTMEVTQAAENASIGALTGTSTGSISVSKTYVDLKVTAPGAALVGGLAGTQQGGKQELSEVGGKLTVEGEGKTVGLLVGEASDVVLSECVFLGADNSLNGKLFVNYTGNADDDELAVALNAACRDNAHHQPLTENQQKLRDRVVEEMNAMGSVQWKLRKDLVHTCTCQLSGCNGTYNSTTVYYGIPYNHKGGSLRRMLYALDEDGYVKDWLYDMESFDGFDKYIGNDCSTSIAHAYWTVSNSTDFSRCQYMIPHKANYPNAATGLDHDGCYPVGGYNTDFTLNGKNYTIDYLTNNTEQEIYEAYGAMRKGDAYVYINETGGHTRMAAADAVVVRKQNGEIDPKYSYVTSSEQGSTIRRDLPDGTMEVSTYKLNHNYSFANLYYDTAIPVTIEELMTGEMEPATCELLNGQDGYAGMFNGTVKANYYLENVDLSIRNSKGEEVFFHTIWTTSGTSADAGHNDGLLRNYKDDMDMAKFAVPLSKFQFEKGETYTYNVTAHLHTYDDFMVKEGSFTFGTAQ